MLVKLNRYLTKFSILLMTAALIAGMAGCGGGGSQNLEIRTWYDLDAVRDNLAGNHILMNDLDSTTAGYEELAGPTADGGKGWEPIGIANENDAFAGSFDGQGYEIRDLFINRPDESHVGLFGSVYEGRVIKNLGVTNVTVIGEGAVGGLAGSIYHCTVSNSYSSGNVTGTWGVGGLVGTNGGTVSNSYSTGNVTGGNVYVGGLVGANVGTVSNSYSSSNVTSNGALIGGLVGVSEGTVTNSYSTGNVTGNVGVGGLVGANGYSGPGTVSNSYSTGSVTGESYVGGLVGSNEQSAVTDSYSTGSVTGESYVGGLVGWNEAGSVSNSYSTGSVAGNLSVGGLVGWNEDGTVSNSFWDTVTSGQATSDGGTGKTTTEMQDIDIFSGAGWNIIEVGGPGERNPAYIWNIVNNVTYPFLSWQAI